MTAQDSLLTAYKNAAERHGKYTQSSNSAKANTAYYELRSILKKLRCQPDRGESFLTELLQNHNIAVATWAATHLLPIHEEMAVKKLKFLAAGDDLIAFDAEIVLDEWRSGRLVID